MNPATQSIIRSVLKIGAGYLVAKGLADETSSQELVGGLVAVISVVWGIFHRSGAPKP